MPALQLQAQPILAAVPGPWGKAIERLRMARGKTRGWVAKKAGMTPTTYGRIERGHHTQTSKLQAIADTLEVPIEDVLLVREDRGADPRSTLQHLVDQAVERRFAQREPHES